MTERHRAGAGRREQGAGRILAILLLGVGLQLAFAAEQPPVAAKDYTEERQILEKDLARFYELIVRDDDPASKTSFRGYHQEYVRRANLLMQNFDAKKYDDLRYDINVHCQRLAKRLAPLAILPRVQQIEVGREVALAGFDPSPEDAAEVRAALDAADAAIKRQEERVGKLPAGRDRDAQVQWIQRLKERRSELAKRFTRPAWDVFVGELSSGKR
jgi:hypothetical protein